MSKSEAIPSFSMREGSASMISLHAYGLTRFAEPTSTAVAPAIIISITLSAVDTPPHPIIGMFTAEATCQIILTGNGENRPPRKTANFVGDNRTACLGVDSHAEQRVYKTQTVGSGILCRAGNLHYIGDIRCEFDIQRLGDNLFTAFTTSATDSG